MSKCLKPSIIEVLCSSGANLKVLISIIGWSPGCSKVHNRQQWRSCLFQATKLIRTALSYLTVTGINNRLLADELGLLILFSIQDRH